MLGEKKDFNEILVLLFNSGTIGLCANDAGIER